MGLDQAKRMLSSHGVDLTLRTFSHDGTFDGQGDPNFTESTATVRGLKDERATGQNDRIRTAAGEEVMVDAAFYVAGDQTINDQNPNPGEPWRRPEIDDTDGQTYKVLSVSGPQAGIRTVWCQRGRS